MPVMFKFEVKRKRLRKLKKNRTVAKFLLSIKKCGGEVQSKSVAKFLKTKKNCGGEVQSQTVANFLQSKKYCVGEVQSQNKCGGGVQSKNKCGGEELRPQNSRFDKQHIFCETYSGGGGVSNIFFVRQLFFRHPKKIKNVIANPFFATPFFFKSYRHPHFFATPICTPWFFRQVINLQAQIRP